VAPSLEEQLRAASASPSVANQSLPPVEKLGQSNTPVVAKQPTLLIRAEASPVGSPHDDEQTADKPMGKALRPVLTPSTESPAVQEPMKEAAVRDGPSVDPKVALPPSAEDLAALPEGLLRDQSAKDTPKAPKVVHLPPQEVQEARLEETERKLEKAAEREQKEDEGLRLALPNANGPPDQASSPSSTVGPYSQATPRAQPHSPDTSPETESFHDTVPSQAEHEIVPDPVAQEEKDEHERVLHEQMRQARERARADSSPTDDVEKQIEEEQTIRLARDGKGRLSEVESAPPAGPEALTSHAEEVVREAQVEAQVEAPVSLHRRIDSEPAADSLPTPTTTAPESSTVENEGMENIGTESEHPALGPEHPTPPADVDVEMEEAPLLIKKQEGIPEKEQVTEKVKEQIKVQKVVQEKVQGKQEQQKEEQEMVQEKDVEEQEQLSPRRRMTTRVSSGAIRQKSISEIIEERNEKTAPKSALTSRPSTPSGFASPARPVRTEKRKPVSTVIFAKPDLGRATKTLQSFHEDYSSLQGASESGRDYLQGLFQYQAHHQPRSKPLQDLVNSAQKTLSTAGTLAMIREQQDYKILKRVYQLQNANRWSLRQLSKSLEPERPTTHHDHLLAEMKWMQTDFTEERKWKRAMAATFAEWCAEYVNSKPGDRSLLRVRSRIPKMSRSNAADEDMNDAPTPDLIHSAAHETESESFLDDDELLSPLSANIPASLFSLGFNDVVLKIDRTPTSDAMFRELPLYEPMLEGSSDVSPLAFVNPPILPVSKYVAGKLVTRVRGPPRKRSRFEYESEDESSAPPSRAGTSAEHSMPSTPGRRLFHRNDLPPDMNDIALFNPENRHIRDRLQASSQFRPPTEFPMPSVSFFESRLSSQWLWEEDQKLRALVKEYTFNWSLVSQQLALPSMFAAGSGRRTPWECFERWVQLEGLPAEMSKTQYFRTYQSRLEQAQRTVLAQHQAHQQLLQQQQQNGQTVGQPRRRTSQPIRVERRRDNRHLAIIDGMRKLARKRESQAHKNSESQKAAALRKVQEPPTPKTNIQTPQEFSRLKWEREEKIKQNMQQQIMARVSRLSTSNFKRANVQQQMAARQQQQMQQAGMANQQQRNGTPGNIANAPALMANPTQQGLGIHASNNMAARAQQNQQMMQANFPNANMNGMSMGSSGVPQAQMQANMQNAQRMAPPDQVRLAMQQRGQFNNANQQHQFQMQQQQMNMANNMSQNMGMNGMPNVNMIAAMAGQNMNGNMNGHMNGSMNGSINSMSNNTGSPRITQANPNMQSPARPLSNGHMPQLLQMQNNLKAQHPDWSQEQVQKAASDSLSRFLAKQRAQAMNAAAGSSGGSQSPQMGNNMYIQNVQNGNMGANSPSPNAVQNYQAQLVRQQQMMSQQQRQQAGSPGMGAAQPSPGATPQNPNMQQSPVMQSPSMQSPSMQQSPGMQQAQLSRNQ
jgi:chromatin modification-related protein VID21